MIVELCKYYMDWNAESFNMTLNKFRYKFIKKFVIKLLMNYIYNNYCCESMYCNKEMVRTSLIKRMQIQYLYE